MERENASHIGLFERTAELSAGRELLIRARQQDGSLLLFEGPAGVGKTALLTVLESGARRNGVRPLVTRATELSSSVPFGVVRRLIAPLVDDQPALLSGGLAAAAAPVFANLGAADVRARADDDDTHAVDTDGDAGAGADPEASHEPQLVHGLISLLANATSPATSTRAASRLLLIVDDLQWADAPSLLFFAELAAHLPEVGVGVALGLRTDEPAVHPGLVDRIRGARRARCVEPGPLSDGAVGRLVEEVLGDVGDASFVPLVCQATGGNPLLVAEVVATLRIRGAELAEARHLEQVLSEYVPDAVARSVSMRLEPLGASTRTLAEAAALLAEAPLVRVAQLARLGIGEAEAAADALAARRIIARGEPVRFEHPLIAAAIVATVPPFRRGGMHRRAAELLNVGGTDHDAVVAHLLEARPEADEWAAMTLREAARSALARGAPDAAVRFLTRALEEPPPARLHGELTIDLARAQALAGDPEAIARLQTGLRSVEEPGLRVEAWHSLSRLLIMCEDFNAAALAATNGLGEARPGDPRRERLLAALLDAWMAMPNRAAQAHEIAAGLLASAREGRPPAEPSLLGHLIRFLGRRGEGLDLIPSLAARALAVDPLVDVRSHGMDAVRVARGLYWVDDIPAAAAMQDAALLRARELGDGLAEATLRGSRAWTHLYAGELRQAEALLVGVMAGSVGWDANFGMVGPPLALIRLERNDITGAREALALAARSTQAGFGFATGRLLMATGEPEAALVAFTSEGETLEALGMTNPAILPWRSAAALAARRLGDHEQARELAQTELVRSRRLGIPRAVGVSLRAAGLCAEGGSSLELLTESAAVLERSSSRLDLIRSLVELGAAQRRERQGAAARETLSRALELAGSCGSTVLAGRAREELEAAGGQQRRSSDTGVDALTVSERRVAELAAAGLTTRALAEQLYLSPRTVDAHLAKIFRKLGIGSRKELADKLGEQE